MIARSPVETLEARTRSGMLFAPRTGEDGRPIPGRTKFTAKFQFQRIVRVDSLGARGDESVMVESITVRGEEQIVEGLGHVPIGVLGGAGLVIPTLSPGDLLEIRVSLREPTSERSWDDRGAWAFVLETTESY